MQRTITLEILEAFFNCRLKAYLKLAGHEGVRSDYEATRLASREEVRRKVFHKIQRRHKQDKIAIGASVNQAELAREADETPCVRCCRVLSVHFESVLPLRSCRCSTRAINKE